MARRQQPRRFRARPRDLRPVLWLRLYGLWHRRSRLRRRLCRLLPGRLHRMSHGIPGMLQVWVGALPLRLLVLLRLTSMSVGAPSAKCAHCPTCASTRYVVTVCRELVHYACPLPSVRTLASSGVAFMFLFVTLYHYSNIYFRFCIHI